MKLMYTYKDNDFFIRVIIENCNCIRWCDEPLRITGMGKSGLVKVHKGTVMPKHWMR